MEAPVTLVRGLRSQPNADKYIRMLIGAVCRAEGVKYKDPGKEHIDVRIRTQSHHVFYAIRFKTPLIDVLVSREFWQRMQSTVGRYPYDFRTHSVKS